MDVVLRENGHITVCSWEVCFNLGDAVLFVHILLISNMLATLNFRNRSKRVDKAKTAEQSCDTSHNNNKKKMTWLFNNNRYCMLYIKYFIIGRLKIW